MGVQQVLSCRSVTPQQQHCLPCCVWGPISLLSFSAGSAFISSASPLFPPVFLCCFCFHFFISSFPSFLALLVLLSFLLHLLFFLLPLRLLFCLFHPSFFFFPLASSSLPNLVPCFVSAEQLGFFPLLELCNTAKDYKVFQVKAAHEHMKVQRLSWGRFRFAGCLPVLLLYIILLSPSAVMETVCGSCCGAQMIFLGSCE